MNDILHLKGIFEQKVNKSKPGAPTLPKNTVVENRNLLALKNDLIEMKLFWEGNIYFNGALISVYYNKIAAKSNRIKVLLAPIGKSSNSTIVGAKFSHKKNKHIITHYVPIEAIDTSINLLNKAIYLLENEFKGSINDVVFNDKSTYGKLKFEDYSIAKTTFQKIIADSVFVEKFDVEKIELDVNKKSIVTIYDTGNDTQELLQKMNIKIYNDRIIDRTTILLDEKYMDILKEKAPYLVAMATENLTELAPSDFLNTEEACQVTVPSPDNEPTIGVIDTLFSENVYFSEWVEFINMVDENIPIESSDYNHGTAVSSIIVDGPSINPTLDDGCGRFKVRHFGVATKKGFNSFTIIRTIKKIISENKDIHVWNLSLGSNEEVNNNFISAEAAVLDQIQFDNDVIFVIAGTNKYSNESSKRIGAPADSINSMIVNSVDSEQKPASYSREGIVLSFFTKPDVSYYGGSKEKFMEVCEPNGKARVAGTSFAAPWVARKLSYLIDIIGLNKEVAKALLIDSAIGWENSGDYDVLSTKGHGVVPMKIDDIIKSPSDEIKFFVSGVSEKYDTFNYNFPVPVHQDKHPFLAKATLCYFPKCSRNQGVDYTNTELDIYFGRIDNKGMLKSINNNKQSSLNTESHYLNEESARKIFRKWDNIKHISEGIKLNMRGKKVYTNSMWGMSIKTKERLNNRDGEGIRFGVVVTLKEINGVNRIDDFIQQCSLKGWLVNRVNVENRIDIYETADEIIEFD